jgi:hypothetical protein
MAEADSITNRYATTIRVGQVWADNDPRCAGRTLRVVAIVRSYERKIQCEVLTGAGGKPLAKSREVTIKADRFWPNATGYRLIEEPRR